MKIVPQIGVFRGNAEGADCAFRRPAVGATSRLETWGNCVDAVKSIERIELMLFASAGRSKRNAAAANDTAPFVPVTA
jgi:hypothetical protein